MRCLLQYLWKHGSSYTEVCIGLCAAAVILISSELSDALLDTRQLGKATEEGLLTGRAGLLEKPGVQLGLQAYCPAARHALHGPRHLLSRAAQRLASLHCSCMHDGCLRRSQIHGCFDSALQVTMTKSLQHLGCTYQEKVSHCCFVLSAS